jgi:hypothetical protein
MIRPLEAPVSTLTLKEFPLSCSSRAREAMALGTTFAAPAGLNPLNDTVSPFFMSKAASSGVKMGYESTLIKISSSIV